MSIWFLLSALSFPSIIPFIFPCKHLPASYNISHHFVQPVILQFPISKVIDQFSSIGRLMNDAQKERKVLSWKSTIIVHLVMI